MEPALSSRSVRMTPGRVEPKVQSSLADSAEARTARPSPVSIAFILVFSAYADNVIFSDNYKISARENRNVLHR